MKSLPVDRPTLDDPIYSQKNPYQAFLVVLSIISALPLLQGETSSAVLEEQLGDSMVVAWGLSLLIGSTVVLISELWRGHTWTALSIERSGLLLVGTGAGIYSVTVWATAGEVDDIRFVAAITFAYAAACFWRCFQITRRLAWIRKLVAEVNARHES